MRKITVVIIDDERLAREELKRHLQRCANFTITGEAENADEAEQLINELSPQLIFLDIQMPGRSGFDLLEALDDMPAVIFTTAFDNYAVQAFEINAVDYLVKPIREERFAQSIEKVSARLLAPQKSHTIFVKEGERVYFIQSKEIHLIESAGNYARIWFNDQKVYIKRSLNQLEKKLDATIFFRINRTQLINTSCIRQVESLAKGRLALRLESGEVLQVSGRQSVAFKNRNMV